MARQLLLGAALEASLGLLAKAAIDGEGLRALLEHRPFQEAVVTGLLDPLTGFDLQRAVAEWEDRLPSSYLLSLRRFFNAALLDFAGNGHI